jgi:enterochelin esterase-like enzyme
MTTHALPQSPRLAALQHELERGNADALRAFWNALDTEGTPLVEPSDRAGMVLVTFIWRAAVETRNVVVFGSMDEGDPGRNQMARLLDTDLWHKTYHLRADLRAQYHLAPNDSLAPLTEATDWSARMADVRTDPLNRQPYPDASRPWASSFTLPTAPPQPRVLARPGIAAGTVQEHCVQSAMLGNERNVWVYTPPGYRADGAPYRLLLLFDGRAYLESVPTPTILDNLITAEAIPPLVAILPGNIDPPTRNRELLCNPAFVEFLTQELLPWARQGYHLTADQARTIVAGSSHGGLAAAFAGLLRPDVFGNVLAQSGSFQWKPEDTDEHSWLLRQYLARPALPLHFALDVGLCETAPGAGGSPSTLVANRQMRDALRSRGYPVHYAEFAGGHDYFSWQGTLAQGLLALGGGRSAAGISG